MRFALCVVALLVVLSHSAADQKVGVDVTLVKGIISRTHDKYSLNVSSGTELEITLHWKDQGSLDGPTWCLDNTKIAGLRLERLKLARDCELKLRFTAQEPGATNVTFTCGELRQNILFLIE